MRINYRQIRLILVIFFVLIFPFVQRQWFNLYLFNTNSLSFYSILYYLSGTICPVLICLYSLNNFTYYQFNIKDPKNNRVIKGKTLLTLILLTIIPLSVIIANYLYINLDLIINLFEDQSFLASIRIFHNSYIIFIITIFLIFKQTKILTKKLVLINFFLITLFIWYSEINNINIDNIINLNNYLNLYNSNFNNIVCLFIIEIIYSLWSFLSNKNNLSDWVVYYPLKKDIFNVLKIIIFYLFVIFYYSILE